MTCSIEQFKRQWERERRERRNRRERRERPLALLNTLPGVFSDLGDSGPVHLALLSSHTSPFPGVLSVPLFPLERSGIPR